MDSCFRRNDRSNEAWKTLNNRPITESEIEQAILDWCKRLRYPILSNQDIAPVEYLAERASYQDKERRRT